VSVIDVAPWWKHAACRGADPALYHPEPTVNAKNSAAAKRVCRRCPVQVECLRYAVERREPYGIWGGTTPVERGTTATGQTTPVRLVVAADGRVHRFTLRHSEEVASCLDR